MSKYQLKCSCIICHVETTVQSLNAHISKHKPKSTCKQCGTFLFTKKSFCSRSCSATYHNIRKDYTKFKPGPKATNKPKTKSNQKPRGLRFNCLDKVSYTKVSQCVICKKYHTGVGKSCSDTCKSKLISQSMKELMAEGFNPRGNRGRSKRSYLEQSFSDWLTNRYPHVECVTEQPFRRRDITKTYFVDFYFPQLGLGIELDGSQHKGTVEYDSDRDAYITSEYGITMIRITHQEYKNKTKLDLVQSWLERVDGFEPSSIASKSSS